MCKFQLSESPTCMNISMPWKTTRSFTIVASMHLKICKAKRPLLDRKWENRRQNWRGSKKSTSSFRVRALRPGEEDATVCSIKAWWSRCSTLSRQMKRTTSQVSIVFLAIRTAQNVTSLTSWKIRRTARTEIMSWSQMVSLVISINHSINTVVRSIT